MKADTYNQSGEKTTQTLLPKEVFDVELNLDLMHQVVVSEMSNRRQGTAHARGRGDVSGGGKKPWRQKGTGRARHGSIRSPLWKGGGVTFGPLKDKVYRKKINKKMKKLSLLMALSAKAKSNKLYVLEDIDLKEAKTKLMAGILKKLPLEGTVLFALPNADKKIIQAARNIANVKTMELRNLNALDVLSFKYLLIPKEGIKAAKEFFVK